MPVYQISCNGAMRTFGDCLSRAAQTCPKDFDIMMSSEKQVGSWSEQNVSGSNNIFASNAVNLSGDNFAMVAFSRYLIYNCKKG